MDHQFRSAALGGFNKQDVLDYLELLVKEHSAQMQSMQEQLDQAQQQALEYSQQAGQLNQLRQENQQLLQQNQLIQGELNNSRSQNEHLQAQLNAAQADRAALQTQVDKLQPDAAAYAAVKERTAGVELDAHRRAQGIVDQANDEAQHLHTQMEQWMARMSREYTDLRAQADAAVAHAGGELEKAGKLLTQLTQKLAQQDAVLENMERAYAKCELNKVPAPMPIPEE